MAGTESTAKVQGGSLETWETRTSSRQQAGRRAIPAEQRPGPDVARL